MEIQDYKNWVAKHSQMAIDEPEAYRGAVERWIWIGRGFYILMFAVSASLLGAGIYMGLSGGRSSTWIRLVIFGGIVVLMLVRSLLVRVPPPEGRKVGRDEAPELFAEIDRMVAKLGTRPISTVVVDGTYNAFASASTAFGPFGERLHLGLGMQLLTCMPKSQMVSIIGHELGHHAYGHTSSRTYRVFQTWETLQDSLAKGQSLWTLVIAKFCAWFFPRFSAVTSAARKANEFEADAAGASVTSRESSAGGLIRLRVDEFDRVERHSELINSEVKQGVHAGSYFIPLSKLAGEPAKDAVVEALAANLKLKSYVTDSHPSLSERLEALGIQVDPDAKEVIADLVAKHAGPIEKSAGEELLGATFEKLTKEFDEMWAKHIEQGSQSRQRDVESSKSVLDSATARAVDKARAAVNLGDRARALEILKDTSLTDESDPEALYVKGQLLVESGSEEGIAYLDVASKAPRWNVESLSALYEYYMSKGNEQMATRTREGIEAVSESRAAYDAKIGGLSEKDRLTPCHRLEPRKFDFEALAIKFDNLQKVLQFERVPEVDPTASHVGYLFLFKLPLFVADLSEYRGRLEQALTSQFESDDRDFMWIYTTKDANYDKWSARSELVVWERRGRGE